MGDRKQTLKSLINKILEFSSDYIFVAINQLIQVGSPILVIFILLPRIGKDYFAEIILITSISTYFKLLYDFGFDFFGVRRILISKSDNHKLIVFSGVQGAKMILVITLIIPHFLIGTLLSFEENYLFIIMHILSVALYGFIPFWYFIAFKVFRHITLINFIAQSIFICLCYFFITDSSLWYLYSSFLFLGQLFAVCFAFIFLKIKKSIRLSFNIKLSILYLKNSFSLMSFNFLSNIYVSSSVILLKIFGASTSNITEFGIAEKIIRGIRQIFTPITKILYPRLVQIKKSNYHLFKRIIFRLSILLLLFSSIIYILVNVFYEQIYRLLNSNDAIPNNGFLFGIISLIIVIGTLGGFMSTCYLIVKGLEKVLRNILILASSTFLILSYILFGEYGIIGIAISLIVAESILLLFNIIYFIRDE